MPQQGAGIPYDRLGDMPDHLRRREGQEAVYRETGLVAVVRVHGLRYDDQGVRGTATVARPPGDPAPGPAGPESCPYTSWEFGAGWGYFRISERSWGATYLGWTLYFDAELAYDLTAMGLDGCETIRGLCEAPEPERSLDRFRRFASRVAEFDRVLRRDDGRGRII